MHRTSNRGSIALYFEDPGSTEIRYKWGDISINWHRWGRHPIQYNIKILLPVIETNNPFTIVKSPWTTFSPSMYVRPSAWIAFTYIKKVALRLAVHAIKVALTIAVLLTDDGLVGSEKKARGSPKVQHGATIPVKGIAGSSIKPNGGSTFGWQKCAQTRYSLFNSWMVRIE